MSKGRLTRQELGWLLTQEAQGAAERLRTGMATLTGPPVAAADVTIGPDATAVDETLSALDDTMKMLSSLHARPTGIRGRRGRIDVASLLWEVAPEARVSIEPGSGTEVFGDETELRRMFHVMLGHGSGTGSTVTIRREADEVVVRVLLGPDSSATADTERAWLARMAIRYGGRYELEGSTELLALPADGVESRDDLAQLRKELEEARRQGETYARELAAVWTAGDEAALSSTRPELPSHAAQGRYGALTRLAGGVSACLRAMLSPVGRDLSEMRSSFSSRKSSPDLEMVARTGLDERLEEIRRKLVIVQDFVGELAAVGESGAEESPRIVDLVPLMKSELKTLEARASRAGVDIELRVVPGSQSTDEVPTSVAPTAASLLMRELLLHALAASPRGSAIFATLQSPTPDIGARIIVDDSGTILPSAARDALLALEVEPGTFGRPSTVALFVAAEIALAQGALVEIGDAPVVEGRGGGVRVSVTFPR